MSFLQGLFGPPNVAKLEAKRDVNGLIKALDYQKDAKVRQAAAVVLGRIGGAQAVEPLVIALADTDEETSEAAAAALMLIGQPAHKPLAAALTYGNRPAFVGTRLLAMNDRAAKALGKIGQPAADAILAALTETTNFDRAFHMCRTLAKNGHSLMLMGALTSPDARVRTVASRAVVAMGDAAIEPLIPPLQAAFSDANADVRQAAAEAWNELQLGKPPNPSACAWHAVTLENWQAAISLGKLAVEPLAAALLDSRSYVRRAAAEALMQVGDQRAAELLAIALHDSDAKVRLAAAEGLQKLNPPNDPLTSAWHAVALKRWNRATAMGRLAVEPLLFVLKTLDHEILPEVAKALHSLSQSGALDRQDTVRAIETLAAALQHSATYVRRAAAEALGELHDSDAVSPLVGALQHQDEEVRQKAADALGKLGDACAVAALVNALKDSNEGVRAHAVWALGAINDTGSIPSLTTALSDRSPFVRSAVVGVLRKFGQAAVEPLIAAPLDGNDETRWRAAAKILGDVGDARAAGPLVDRMRTERSPSLSGYLARALRELPVPTDPSLRAWHAVANAKWEESAAMGALAIEPLLFAARDEDYFVRKAAIHALAQVGDPDSIEGLAAALRDEDGDVRAAAARALSKIGVPRDPSIQAWHAVALHRWDDAVGAESIEPLAVALRDRDKQVCQAAAKALERIGIPVNPQVRAWHAVIMRRWDEAIAIGEAAVEPLVIALKDDEISLRAAAAHSLGNITDPRVIPPLIEALNDSVWEVRKAAAEALKQLNKSATLDRNAIQMIAKSHSKTSQQHTDAYCQHSDDHGNQCHGDSGGHHVDRGIGVVL